ncbi:hypothetical protein DTO013E5_9120 [Penicillium roqueforti]|uniref:Genomic scaffold, ProqFM164S03 n=1 Tax=Penicillium roqueforti (strain FM164) TaxID=1365484 RepID=W6QUT7_PENRF|nr:hypothetical protein CBS147355_4832 [Penicillium roqueforti]CDM33297.1 unnamed protein product [Penicillium roqueforti FM164]KAI2686818.1 hypothetical protein LCP963914a_4418 [Penicillium roqueforti]KAI2704195.1 hypothetical protein CBS147372_2664 [Penicillium roqueforti]KAI2735940.1 hypothetical protein DTO012A1_8761 [Penicillium roqueforti]
MTSNENYAVFRECLSNAIVARSEEKQKPARRKPKGKRTGRKDVITATTSQQGEADPEELAEFVDFLASETFTTFPTALQTLSYAAIQHDPTLSTLYIPQDTDTPLPRATLETLFSLIPVSVTDSLVVYGIIPNAADLLDFLAPVLAEYTSSVTTGPLAWASTRADACEICERDWIPLSYHHLIPRGVHAKVVKRGWHDEWMLNSVAWLCRACHSFVHRMASNEELAREWFTVERICEREDVRDWAIWVGRVRWKAR